MMVETTRPVASRPDPGAWNPICWQGDATTGHLVLLDQRRLPNEEVYIECHDLSSVFQAIRTLAVRGAPAIGVAAAYGFVLGLRELAGETIVARAAEVRETLSKSRPTAVNLFWALERMEHHVASGTTHPEEILAEALRIQEEDREMCRHIGQEGASLLPKSGGVLTHCNAGGLATAGEGTAVAVILEAIRQGSRLTVFADETRPLLQGARLTTWEFLKHGIQPTLLCDSMAGWAMHQGKVQAVVVGADRIAANGDVANKIGTYSLALLAKAHEIPFFVAAPSSTFDLGLVTGGAIPIEERGPEEVTEGFGRTTAPAGVKVYNPAFDVTPAHLVSALITEKGVIQPVTAEGVRGILG